MNEEQLARVVAVGNRINLATAATEAGFRAELERIAGLAAPHLVSDRPNLLALAELVGLPAGLVGRRGAVARQARTSRAALTLLALAYWRRLLAYRRRWLGTSAAQALLLALTDALYRPFYETLSALAARYQTHVVATTLAPRVRRSTILDEIRRWGRAGADCVYLPEAPEVYNAALVFGPDGALLGRVNKVYLTREERETLQLTPGKLDDVRVIATAAGRLGIAISLDAFTPEYLERLDAQGAEIVVQCDANDVPWAGPGSGHSWQPQEWLNGVLGSIQPRYASLRYNVCPMQTGNFFDGVFDGQSTITARATAPPDPGGPAERSPCEPFRGGPGRAFVGVDEYVHTVTGEPLLGEFLAVAPWVVADPIEEDAALTLEARRAQLHAVGQELRPGGRRANQYRESVVWADVMVRATSGEGSACDLATGDGDDQ